MTQQTSTSLVLDTNNLARKIPNFTFDTSSLTLGYTLGGNGTQSGNFTIAVSGKASPSTANTDYGAQPGYETVLATISASANGSQAVSLSSVTYDSFSIVATGLSAGVELTVSLSATGAGPGWSSSSLGAISTYAQS